MMWVMRKGKWHMVEQSQKSSPRGDGHDKHGGIGHSCKSTGIKPHMQWGSHRQMSRTGNEGNVFIIICISQVVGAGDSAIGTSIRVWSWGLCRVFYSLISEGHALSYILWIQELITSCHPEFYNLVLKRYLDFSEPSCVGILCSFHLVLQILSTQ